MEARLIQQYIDEAGGENHRFRAVILDLTDEKHVPDTLRTYHRFRVYFKTTASKNLISVANSLSSNDVGDDSLQITMAPAPQILCLGHGRPHRYHHPPYPDIERPILETHTPFESR